MTRVLVLRAREDAERTATALRAKEYKPVVSPVLEIVPTGATIPSGSFDALLSTSVKGVEYVRDQALRRLPLHVVGARTAKIAAALGWTPDIIADDARALGASLLAHYTAPTRFLYLTGRARRDELESCLRNAGHQVVCVETYDARAANSLSPEATAWLARGKIFAVLHYSRRSVEIFLDLAKQAGLMEKLAQAEHLALSAETAAPLLKEPGLRVMVAARPREDRLLALLGEL